MENESAMYASEDVSGLLRQLMGELDNFEGIAKYLLPQPGEIPKLHGVDVWGGTLPLTGVGGGDHIIYIDFKQRFDLQARIRHATEKGRPERKAATPPSDQWRSSRPAREPRSRGGTCQ